MSRPPQESKGIDLGRCPIRERHLHGPVVGRPMKLDKMFGADLCLRLDRLKLLRSVYTLPIIGFKK
jgi:hypothetical protein